MLTHENLISNMILSCQPNPIDESDSMIGVLPFFHIYGMVLILNLSIYRGATLVTMPRFDIEQFLQIVQDYKITCLNLVPPIVLALAKHPVVDNYDVSSVRVIGCGAAPLGEGSRDGLFGQTELSDLPGLWLNGSVWRIPCKPCRRVSREVRFSGPSIAEYAFQNYRY